MSAATLPAQASGKSGVDEHRSGTRNLITSSGETRSQLFQRLRAECVWDAAELLKEQVRAECRNRGETKRQAGISAWDAIARAYPEPDVAAWEKFTSRAYRPPGITSTTDVTDGSKALAVVWAGSMMLLGSLATRCREISENSALLLKLIDFRLSQEPARALIITSDSLCSIARQMADDPIRFLDHARSLFTSYESSDDPYSLAVAEELSNLNEKLELARSMIDQKWPLISSWLWGPRSADVIRYLTRACEAR